MLKKQRILTMLAGILDRWEELLEGIPEAEIAAPDLSGWSVKDTIAHLRAWQQVSVARLEAAQVGRDPELPEWLAGLDPESEQHLEEFNARIYAQYRVQQWTVVHREWRDGFERLIRLAESLSETELLDPARYPWLKGYPLSDVLLGSCEHHDEHLPALLGRAHQQPRADDAE